MRQRFLLRFNTWEEVSQIARTQIVAAASEAGIKSIREATRDGYQVSIRDIQP